MADQKLTGLTAQTTVDPDDLLYAVDVSDTSMAASGTSKKATREALQTYAAGTLTTDKKILDLSATWASPTVSISSLTQTGGLATATTATAHSLIDGESVTIAGATPSAYNGAKTITVVNSTTFTFTIAGGTSSPATGTITGATSRTFTGIKANVTDTASASGSLLMDLQVGGATKYTVRKDGRVNSIAPAGIAAFSVGSLGTTGIGYSGGPSNGDRMTTYINNTAREHWDSTERRMRNDQQFGWSSGAPEATNFDLVLLRDAADTLAQRRTTNAQTFRIYGSYTDGSNYVRASLAATGSAVTLAAQTAGTGDDNITLNLTAAGTGTVTSTSAFTAPQVQLTGNVSAAAWTTSGIGLTNAARTLTDTSSSGTVAAAYTNVLGGNTVAASSSTTFTKYASLHLGSPAAGTNVTITNAFSLITAGAAEFGGVVTAPNLANGRTLQKFTPLDNQPPASNFATLDTRNSVAVLDFDDGATNEEAVFVGVIPQAATLTSGIKVRIYWSATSATSGDVEWGAQFEKYGTDIDSDSFDTATFAKTTTSGTSGIVNLTEITCTTIDSLAAGDQFRLKIVRNSSDTTDDTMTGDAELVAVELQQVA